MLRVIATSAVITLSSVGLFILVADFELLNSRGPWTWIVLTLLFSAIIVDFLIGLGAARERGVHKFSVRNQQNRVRKYMIKLVRDSSSCLIVSRDLSWVDETVEQVLAEKSQSQSLTLVVSRETELTERMKSLGATVSCYGENSISLTTRFTIVNPGTNHMKIAIGASREDTHVIREFRPTDTIPFKLAEDLAAVLQRTPESNSRNG